MKELKPYLVEFDKTGEMMPKIYPLNYEVGGDRRQPVIVIIYDECNFLSNDGPQFE